jgi:hypothetical protein
VAGGVKESKGWVTMHKDESIYIGEIEILLESSAPAEDIAAVDGAFRNAGFVAKVSPVYERKAFTDELPWVVMATVPITAFLSAFAAAAGKDAYDTLKNLVCKIWVKRTKNSGSSGNFILIDSKSGIWVLLDPDIPSDAYSELAKLDINSLTNPNAIKYDKDKKKWISLP